VNNTYLVVLTQAIGPGCQSKDGKPQGIWACFPSSVLSGDDLDSNSYCIV